MDLTLAAGLTGALLALAVFAGWRGARPPDPRRGPRMIPWRPIMLVAATGAIILAGYVLQLLKPGQAG
ncbi:hypothetical protein [Phenylobacterium sp.]|jgi:hypothetical protein|uniref:hypothetical protein n=1 Tax=Phenylobacterium sp. TaxID=1871053 RepID=UPI002F40C0BD